MQKQRRILKIDSALPPLLPPSHSHPMQNPSACSELLGGTVGHAFSRTHNISPLAAHAQIIGQFYGGYEL